MHVKYGGAVFQRTGCMDFVVTAVTEITWKHNPFFFPALQLKLTPQNIHHLLMVAVTMRFHICAFRKNHFAGHDFVTIAKHSPYYTVCHFSFQNFIFFYEHFNVLSESVGFPKNKIDKTIYLKYSI